MKPPHFSVEELRPVAHGLPTQLELYENKIVSIQLAICVPSDLVATCGSPIKFTVETVHGTIERFSTMGGIITIDGRIYGLTTAHAVVNDHFRFLDNKNESTSQQMDRVSESGTDPSTDCSLDSDSDISVVSDLGSCVNLPVNLNTRTGRSPPYLTSGESIPGDIMPRSQNLDGSFSDTVWVNLPEPKVLAYLGCGTSSGNWMFPDTTPDTSDFALLDLGAVNLRSANQYRQSLRQDARKISRYVPTQDTEEGDVIILAQSMGKPYEGHLLHDESSVIVGGRIMRTKIIQIQSAARPGLSGSWVLQNGALCGIVYAGYEKSPLVHMLPIEGIFDDIKQFLQASDIRLALLSDTITSKAPQRPKMDPQSGMNDVGHPGLLPREEARMGQTGQSTDLIALCEHCSVLNFEQFSNPTDSEPSTDPTTAIIPLYRIMENFKEDRPGKKCDLCTALFEAIVPPDHDPFMNPDIARYVPHVYGYTTFKTWVDGSRWYDRIRRIPSPFGQVSAKKTLIPGGSKSNAMMIPESVHTSTTPIKEATTVANAPFGGTPRESRLGVDNQARNLPLSTTAEVYLKRFISALTTKNHKLPLFVWVTLHNISNAYAGLINVTIYADGSPSRVVSSVLSHFDLQVELDHTERSLFSTKRTGDYRIASYGKLITDKVDIERTCDQWLTRCLKNHGNQCAWPAWDNTLDTPGGYHFRLIDVRTRKVIRARNTPEYHRGEEIFYVALSYVWGANTDYLKLYLDQASRECFHPDGQGRQIPPTVEDAINVTKRMSQRYLWVDCLCIAQAPRGFEEDEESKDARAQQIQQMDRIYGNALFTIIAASGDASARLAGVSSPRDPGQISGKVGPVKVLTPVVYDDNYGLWGTRGWTLQESFLSKRMLVFGKNHVSFQCRHEILCEDMPARGGLHGPPPIPQLSLPPRSKPPLTVAWDARAILLRSFSPNSQLSLPPWSTAPVTVAWDANAVLLRSSAFDQYAELVAQYTSRHITFSQDIIDAFQGILNVLVGMTHYEIPKRPRQGSSKSPTADAGKQKTHTLYGLLEEHLDLALLWQPPAAIQANLTRRKGFPSWSWAGWKVSKDRADADAEAKAHLGVRFDIPFSVSENDDRSLKKLIATCEDAEERLRPLIMWYKLSNTPHTPSSGLEYVNGTGLGVLSGSDSIDNTFIRRIGLFLLEKIDKDSELKPPQLPINIPFDNRHLVCQTQTAEFRLGQPRLRKEYIWKNEGKELETVLDVTEAEILDEMDQVVGHVIPTNKQRGVGKDKYSLILLSESQYWGNEARIDVQDYPLYNVMVVEWQGLENFAMRWGLGKIRKSGWAAANPRPKTVILK